MLIIVQIYNLLINMLLYNAFNFSVKIFLINKHLQMASVVSWSKSF